MIRAFFIVLLLLTGCATGRELTHYREALARADTVTVTLETGARFRHVSFVEMVLPGEPDRDVPRWWRPKEVMPNSLPQVPKHNLSVSEQGHAVTGAAHPINADSTKEVMPNAGQPEQRTGLHVTSGARENDAASVLGPAPDTATGEVGQHGPQAATLAPLLVVVTLPDRLAGPGCGTDTTARSWMRAEVAVQRRATDWTRPVFAPTVIATSAQEYPPGAICTLAVSPQAPGDVLLARARNAAGVGCWGPLVVNGWRGE